MRTLFTVVFAFLSISLFSQEMPVIKVGSHRIHITSFNVKVEVVGNIATTSYDMLFYNPTDFDLEGELTFPLEERQEVSKFAIEFNGEFREALVVENEQASINNQGVNPIVLKRIRDNTYKALIYPLPSKEHKRVVLTYDEEILFNEGSIDYHLPLNFNTTLDQFVFEMDVFDQKLKPELIKGFADDFEFKLSGNDYYVETEKENYAPNESLIVKIPLEHTFNKISTFEDYFYIYQHTDIVKTSEVTLMFIGVESSNKNIELFPNISMEVSNDFSISGKGAKPNDTLVLKFGHGNQTLNREFVIPSEGFNNPIVKKIWAKKKLRYLERDSNQNKKDIIAHCKLYNLASNYTSLAIFETVMDYVTYKNSPNGAFREDHILENGNGLTKTNSGNISGTITDSSGLPLLGVNIMVKGTTTGIQTNTDGYYTINAKKGDILVYSYIGMLTLENTLENTTIIDVVLNEDPEKLEEVVVNADKISREQKSRTYSSTTITSDKLIKGGYTDIIQALQGTVAGLVIREDDIFLRGGIQIIDPITGIPKNVPPLFIYDGMPLEFEDIKNINFYDIEEIEVIKSASQSLRYGPRAIGGVIVITSKSKN
ncbi:carboxypeptidase-like regulatory domain-containing protein [Confluentibacter citreus]|uniref:carboxypeptidase-like regulatory domain-containing protein n=1 Tax=Confluentibacter citreus TaxID=2007307 RepID=UPI000C289C92|nr:carboxypeptidase-like regulatory domain-containing protein [Confluentibacter citreus]